MHLKKANSREATTKTSTRLNKKQHQKESEEGKKGEVRVYILYIYKKMLKAPQEGEGDIKLLNQ